MRTICTNVYSFNELSNEGKEKAIQRYRETTWENGDYAWDKENAESMEAFAEIFPIKVTNWSYGGRGEGVTFRFTSDYDEIEEMTGLRLAKYIWNNYRYQIYSFKYYGDANVKHCIYHKRIKTKDYKNGNFGNAYYSAITMEKDNCPLTGYCMDNSLLDEIYSFMNKPDNRTFKELLGDCFDNWVKACNDDRDAQDSDEYITETIEANEYEFDEDGNMA